MANQITPRISFDELVARIATQPVPVLARAIAKQAAALGGASDWSGTTANLLASHVEEAVAGLNLPSISACSREPVLFWRSLAT